ncbi:hypothetical protein LTSEMIS_0284 [Salmonella enterica subsp. enterica serovar Mississippi str. A4-633]|nr:hypothetical protein LTSEMIS_0284 [Salmonella enterica subsp. enterica serovar Mississippi str. A4-633]
MDRLDTGLSLTKTFTLYVPTGVGLPSEYLLISIVEALLPIKKELSYSTLSAEILLWL